MREQRSLAAVTVSADDRRVRVRRLPTYEVIRESPAGTWPQVGSAVPRLLVPPRLDLRSPDACVFVLKANARPAAWIDGKQIASRLGGSPERTNADRVVAIEPQAQAALVRVEGLPDASAAFDLALVSRDGASVERTRLWARESVGDWLVPLLDS